MKAQRSRRWSALTAFVALASSVGCAPEPCPNDDCTDVLEVTLAHASAAFAFEDTRLAVCADFLCTHFHLRRAADGSMTCEAADGTPFPGLVGACSVGADDVMKLTAFGSRNDDFNVVVDIGGSHGEQVFRGVLEDVSTAATCGDECRRAEASFTIP